MSPSPLILRRDQVVVVLVDVQERLHAEVVRREAMAVNFVRLAEAARLLEIPVIVTEHAVKAFGPTIEPLRAALAGVDPVHKTHFSCFGSDAFLAKLAEIGRKQVVLAGYETHICVCQTALDAAAAGHPVHLVRDATSARAESSIQVGIEKMAAGGVIPATVETVIFELLGRAGTDEFRALLPVIKRTV